MFQRNKFFLLGIKIQLAVGFIVFLGMDSFWLDGGVLAIRFCSDNFMSETYKSYNFYLKSHYS